ncbi:hypothetical protein HanRHA438_Chr09g0391611 [Helianthus annuus]|nr:hypothetical protein HanRHA438_Chr09g0391611 [Helianthus annuus]
MHLTDCKPRAIRSVTADQNQKFLQLPSIDHAMYNAEFLMLLLQCRDHFAQPLHA